MSIKDNMLWGKADATDEEIADALQKAHIWHDIERMPFRTATLATNLRYVIYTCVTCVTCVNVVVTLSLLEYL